MSTHRYCAAVVSAALVGIAITAPAASAGRIVTIENQTAIKVQWADLLGFTNANNTGAQTVFLKKNDPTDDVLIPAFGKVQFDIGTSKSMVSSTIARSGAEIEIYTKGAALTTSPTTLAFLDVTSPGAPLYAIDYDSTNGSVPALGFAGPVTSGKLANPAFSWITFFDVSASGGLILRDASGNPTSPLLSGVTVEVGFLYSMSIPAPGTVSLIAIVGLTSFRRRRDT